MGSAPLVKVSAKAASDVTARFELSAEAQPLARPGMTPAQLLDLLIEKQHYPDAVHLLAHGLPKREGVWWACVVSRQVGGGTMPAPVAAALKSAERWVHDPTEENRQAALPSAEAATYGQPAGCAALGAFLSGGSLGPPTAPAVPPAEHLTGNAVAGAIILAAVMKEPEKANDKFKAFLTKGIEIGNGRGLWK